MRNTPPNPTGTSPYLSPTAFLIQDTKLSSPVLPLAFISMTGPGIPSHARILARGPDSVDGNVSSMQEPSYDYRCWDNGIVWYCV